jgi:hypothetical protein
MIVMTLDRLRKEAEYFESFHLAQDVSIVTSDVFLLFFIIRDTTEDSCWQTKNWLNIVCITLKHKNIAVRMKL